MKVEKSNIPIPEKKDKDVRSAKGRSSIEDNRRTGSWSKRAAKGQKYVIEQKCPKCSHHKAIETLYLGNKRCTSCGYNYKDAKKRK